MSCGDCLSVKEANKEDLIDVARGFHGLGVGSHRVFGHSLIAYVSRGTAVPKKVEGIRVLKKWTNPVRSLSARRYPAVRTLDSFSRPVAGGNSVGAYSSLLQGYITGTVGMAFQAADGSTQILSNNHVLCGIDTVQRGGATSGSPLFQPGAYFGGSPGAGTFASLYKWGKIDEKQPNELDWATGLVPDPSQVSGQVLNVGTPAAVADPVLGLRLAKMGALSGLTAGNVIDLHATIDVDYEGLFVATFDNQIVVEGVGGPFAVPGDSGSVALANVDGQLVACGLVFSGSSTIAVANKMSIVQQAIGSALQTATLTETSTPTGPNFALLTLVGGASYILTRHAV